MQIHRLFEILYLLLDKKNITAIELADHFEVSKRTILRDIDVLTAAGIPIYTSQGKGGGIKILDSFVLDKTLISEEEQNKIMFALQCISSTQHIDVTDVLSKLNAIFENSKNNLLKADFSRLGNIASNKKRFKPHKLDDKLLSCFGNPVKTKLFLEFYEQKQVTTGQLLEKYSEIPQTTLYRHLKKMLTDNIIKVVGENHIHGRVEKVYSLGFDYDKSVENMAAENDGKTYLHIVTQNMIGILREFQEYISKANIDLASDGSGFLVEPIYATVEELKEATVKIKAILSPLKTNQPNGKCKLRNICIIATPPKD